MRGEIQPDQGHISALALVDGLQRIAAGRFPLPCHRRVQAQSRQGGHTQKSEVDPLGHGDGLFEGAPCLFPLLHGLIDTAQGSERALQEERQRKGRSATACCMSPSASSYAPASTNPNVRQGILTTCVQTFLLSCRERERSAATGNALLHLPGIHLCQSQECPGQGFCGAIAQGLGERSATGKGGKGQLTRSKRLRVQSGIQLQGRFLKVDRLLKVSRG